MEIKIIDPTLYQGWDNLLSKHFPADIFNSASWCKVLKYTYNFEPKYFLALEKDAPLAIVPLIEIKSPITGKRAVSLPFSDYCNLLGDPFYILKILKDHILFYGRTEKWRYIEFRGKYFPEACYPSEVFLTHDIDLTASSEKLWKSLKDSNRRNIKKAVKYGLNVNFENDLGCLLNFYRLQVITRKRHGLPPQPLAFFHNIYKEILLKNLGIIVTIYSKGKLIAASIYLVFNRKAIYKFGASDHAYHFLRPNNLIMWEAINWLKENKCNTLNLGRTDSDDLGLLAYKRLWGGIESELKYHRYNIRLDKYVQPRHKTSKKFNTIIKCIPIPVLRLLGNIAYKHIG